MDDEQGFCVDGSRITHSGTDKRIAHGFKRELTFHHYKGAQCRICQGGISTRYPPSAMDCERSRRTSNTLLLCDECQTLCGYQYCGRCNRYMSMDNFVGVNGAYCIRDTQRRSSPHKRGPPPNCRANPIQECTRDRLRPQQYECLDNYGPDRLRNVRDVFERYIEYGFGSSTGDARESIPSEMTFARAGEVVKRINTMLSPQPELPRRNTQPTQWYQGPLHYQYGPQPTVRLIPPGHGYFPGGPPQHMPRSNPHHGAAASPRPAPSPYVHPVRSHPPPQPSCAHPHATYCGCPPPPPPGTDAGVNNGGSEHTSPQHHQNAQLIYVLMPPHGNAPGYPAAYPYPAYPANYQMHARGGGHGPPPPGQQPYSHNQQRGPPSSSSASSASTTSNSGEQNRWPAPRSNNSDDGGDGDDGGETTPSSSTSASNGNE